MGKLTAPLKGGELQGRRGTERVGVRTIPTLRRREAASKDLREEYYVF